MDVVSFVAEAGAGDTVMFVVLDVDMSELLSRPQPVITIGKQMMDAMTAKVCGDDFI